jgi:hypothetical protein
MTVLGEAMHRLNHVEHIGRTVSTKTAEAEVILWKCSELCGVLPGFMPIGLKALSLPEFYSYLSELAAAPLISSKRSASSFLRFPEKVPVPNILVLGFYDFLNRKIGQGCLVALHSSSAHC